MKVIGCLFLMNFCMGCMSRSSDAVCEELSGFLEKQSILTRVEKDTRRRSVVFHLKEYNGVGTLDLFRISSEKHDFKPDGENCWLVSNKDDGKLMGVVYDQSDRGRQIIWVRGAIR